ncbi:MAG: hypothetical protein Q9179_001726 [Wetmoreana sp. 5 TL-2023]
MNEALRRGAWTCIACSSVPRSPQALIASSAVKHPGSRHQRNHSSSKASSPPKNESRPLTTASEAPSHDPPTRPRVEKRPSGRRSSRIATKPSTAKARLGAYPNVPSVPSTQHLHPMNVHVASFFSRHRPISVTSSFPPTSTEATFSSIFEPKPSQKSTPADVIYTVSSAIDSLENAALQQSPSAPQRPNNEPTHLDGKPQHISLDIGELSKTFRPFNVPPPPVPMTDAPKASESLRRRTRAAPAKERTYTAVLTITEQAHPNGRRTYQASLSPMREENFFTSHTPPSPSSLIAPSPTSTDPYPAAIQHSEEVEVYHITPPTQSSRQPFLDRMRNRQQVWEEGLMGKKREIWRAISVKRQRKLKMKKHKYKKLMRKTRNLRRKLDRN